MLDESELKQLAGELREKWKGGEKPLLEVLLRPGDYEPWSVASYLLPEVLVDQEGKEFVPVLGGETPEEAAAAGRRALKEAERASSPGGV